MYSLERKKGLYVALTGMLLLMSACGDGAKEDAERKPTPKEGLVSTQAPDISVTGEPEVTEGEKNPNPTGDLSTVSSFFEFPDTAIAPRLKTKQGDKGFTFFRSTIVDGMEFAVLDCLFLSENIFGEEDRYSREQLLMYFPQYTEETKVFLRRKEGSETWEAAVMEDVSKIGYSDPYIAFNSKENGMLVFGAEYAYFCVTEDGGMTWIPAGSVPSPAESVVGSVRCMAGCGEGRFLVGHRYKTEPVTGLLSLTEDNGQTWADIVLPPPQTGELQYCYSEPVEFREQDGKLFVRMHAYAEDAALETESGQVSRKEAFYELFSVDGGSAWEFVQPESLEFQSVD